MNSTKFFFLAFFPCCLLVWEEFFCHVSFLFSFFISSSWFNTVFSLLPQCFMMLYLHVPVDYTSAYINHRPPFPLSFFFFLIFSHFPAKSSLYLPCSFSLWFFLLVILYDEGVISGLDIYVRLDVWKFGNLDWGRGIGIRAYICYKI